MTIIIVQCISYCKRSQRLEIASWARRKRRKSGAFLGLPFWGDGGWLWRAGSTKIYDGPTVDFYAISLSRESCFMRRNSFIVAESKGTLDIIEFLLCVRLEYLSDLQEWFVH